ncbi:MAG: undecaprenyl-phosphate glucose phosphotransferase [Anaerolineae bacterium]|nr:undecaprenyl-phosphate glucose phosphotransferase [Thermoflexales bacterium]MDW8054645.1 undecaprenyl-phosphate glucose phosphotransferase [Anaerolineae bacterium]
MQRALTQPATTQPVVHRRRLQTWITLSLVALDALSVVLGFYAAYWLRLVVPFPAEAQNVPPFAVFFPLLVVQVGAILSAFFFARMYHRQRIRYSTDDLAAIFSAVSIGTLASVAFATFWRNPQFEITDAPRVMIIYAWLLTIAIAVVLRAAHMQVQRALHARGIGRTRVVVVGSGEPAHTVLHRLLTLPRLGYDVLGLVPWDGYRPELAVNVLGGLEELSAMVRSGVVDEVIIALPEADSETLLRIIEHCDRSTISIKVLPDQFQIMAGQLSISELGGLPLLNMRDVALRGWKITLKRAIDIVGSAAGLVFLSPLMFLIALLIKLDSPGPALFSQERMGLDGKRFYMLKFRTMRVDAEKDGPGWTRKDDPRRTRVGAILRRTNLDELPQLINVLLGEMSLVGPRPERPVYVEEFRKRIPRYMERHREKAGMTGWAQVNGLRGDTSIEERTKYDLWYIENWSVWLDIKIILLTIWQAITGRSENAY